MTKYKKCAKCNSKDVYVSWMDEFFVTKGMRCLDCDYIAVVHQND